MRYISNKFGPSELSGKNVKDKAIVDMILSFNQEIKRDVVEPFYWTGDRGVLKKIIEERFSRVVDFLGDKKFIVGDYLTLVDFYIFEQIELLNIGSDEDLLSKYPNLAKYHNNIKSLPRVSEFYNSDKLMKIPINNKVAKINNLK